MPSLRSMLLCAPLTLAACDDGMDDEGGGALEPRGCAVETRADTYALGMVATGERVDVTFVDAMPAPPARGDNTWRVAITDAAGVALSDLSIDVEPFMPDHMHGTSIAAHATPAANPGEYDLAPVNLFMPGLWEVTLRLGLPDGTTDDVEVAFCIDP